MGDDTALRKLILVTNQSDREFSRSEVETRIGCTCTQIVASFQVYVTRLKWEVIRSCDLMLSEPLSTHQIQRQRSRTPVNQFSSSQLQPNLRALTTAKRQSISLDPILGIPIL